MIRKILVLTAGVMALLFAWAGVASAQASPPSSAVLPSSVVQVRGEQLARTGTDPMLKIYVGAGLAAGGVVLVVAARRRRHRHVALT